MWGGRNWTRRFPYWRKRWGNSPAEGRGCVLSPMKHFLSIEKLARAEILDLLESAREYKATRCKSDSRPLQGQIWALLFNKPSTRTRVSFEVGIREFGA